MNGLKNEIPLGSLIKSMTCLLLCCLLSCSSQDKSIERKENLVHVKIEVIRDNAQADDSEVEALLEDADKRLKEARDLHTMQDDFQANAMLDDLLFRLDNYLRFGTDQDVGDKSVLSHGSNNAWMPSANDDFQPLEGDEAFENMRGLKAGFRSTMILTPDPNLTLQLLAETEVLLNHAGSRTTLELLKGTLLITKQGRSRLITLKQGPFQAQLEEDALIEFSRSDITKAGYLSIFDGAFSWSCMGKSGKAELLKAVSWHGDSVEMINLPSAPRIEHPTNHSTIHLEGRESVDVPFRWYTQLFNKNFQVQVSKEDHFTTRVYDNSNLVDHNNDVPLKAGEYHWRVRGFIEDSDGYKVPGPFTKAMVLYISKSNLKRGQAPEETNQDLGPKPSLNHLDFQTIGTSIIITGKTAPSMRVKVNGVSAIVSDDGSFRAIIESGPGEQTIRLVVTNPSSGAKTVKEQKIRL